MIANRWDVEAVHVNQHHDLNLERPLCIEKLLCCHHSKQNWWMANICVRSCRVVLPRHLFRVEPFIQCEYESMLDGMRQRLFVMMGMLQSGAKRWTSLSLKGQ